MFEKMNEITLSGEVYPLRCDMVVLEQIQDAYGTVEVFEVNFTLSLGKPNSSSTSGLFILKASCTCISI